MVCECVYMQKRKGTLTYNLISNLNDSFGSRYFLNVMN